MKLNMMKRSAMAAGVSLALGLGISACSRDYTAAYVYAISNAGGKVSAFGVDYQTGVLSELSGSPFVTNLTNPVTIVAAPNGKTMYAIGGTQTAQVQIIAIGSDGKIYLKDTPDFAAGGTYGTAAAIDSTGTYLYVTYTYQNGFGPVSQGPGGISIYKIDADGSLEPPTNVNVGNNPIAIAVSAPTCTTTGNGACASGETPNVFVYVVDAEVKAANPTIVAFAQNTGTGALTPTANSVCAPSPGTCTGTSVGVSPSSIAIDPTARYLYVTDKLQNNIYGYQIASTTTGGLIPLVSSPTATGDYPLSITIEPRGKYVYVANYNSQTVSSYSLNMANGSLGGSASGGGFGVKAGPTCITVEPALGIYLYTSDYLNGSISGGQLSPDTGQVSAVINTPFPTGTQPTCLTAVANGPHSSQLVQP